LSGGRGRQRGLSHFRTGWYRKWTVVGLAQPDDAAILQPAAGKQLAVTTDFFAAPLDDPQAKAMATMMLQQMCDGMHLELQVAVKGRITATNASYASRRSNTVGLYRMDFDKLVKNQAALGKLLSLEPAADAEDAKQQLQDPLLAEYLKLEMNERVNVSFE
jgi:hypothetical protein